MISGLSHITFIVRDLERTAVFFRSVFDAKQVYYSGDKIFSLSPEMFFLVGDVWVCIMEGEGLGERSYGHVAFKVDDCDFEEYVGRVERLGLDVFPGRARVEGEGRSVYFYDFDNHLFEIHTGTLEGRLESYAREVGSEYMRVELVSERDCELIGRLLEIWEASVRASHDFLSEGDVLALKPLVREALVGIQRLFTAWVGEDVVAFMGLDGDMLEMLFVSPEVMGRGVGKALVSEATVNFGVRRVDVNEQNPKARGFYERMGFKVTGRDELDGQGNPFPILHMELE